jgi:hypothetical protein
MKLLEIYEWKQINGTDLECLFTILCKKVCAVLRPIINKTCNQSVLSKGKIMKIKRENHRIKRGEAR